MNQLQFFLSLFCIPSIIAQINYLFVEQLSYLSVGSAGYSTMCSFLENINEIGTTSYRVKDIICKVIVDSLDNINGNGLAFIFNESFRLSICTEQWGVVL
jgi:hypothetical protein